jgi:hypothetical protein
MQPIQDLDLDRTFDQVPDIAWEIPEIESYLMFLRMLQTQVATSIT